MNLPIAIIISLFGLCITMPLFVRYFAYSNLPFVWKIVGFLICLIIATLPIFVSRDWAHIYGKHFTFIEYTLYFIYIFAIILFVLTFARDIVWIILNCIKSFPSPFNSTIFDKVNIATIILAFILSGWSLYEGIKVPTEKHLTLLNPKIQQEKTIVVLSDLHISRTTNPQKINAIVKKTNTLKPDLILLAGDILDDEPQVIRETTKLLGNLRAKQGTYFVSGNHEFYIGYRAAMQALKDVGLTSIENKKVQLEPHFYLAGVSDTRSTTRFGQKSNIQDILSDIPDAAYTLFVSHSPTPIDLPFDLQVSGHTHGGQIFPFHFFSWLANHHLLAGFYPTERIYVSRGSGQWGPQMRFFAPSEISVLHIKKEKQ